MQQHRCVFAHVCVCDRVESHCALPLHNVSVCARCIINDEAADCDAGLTFHSQLPLGVKNDSLCPPSRPGYYNSPSVCKPVPCCNQSLSYITLSILGTLSHVILASFVLYVRVHYRRIFRSSVFSARFFSCLLEVHLMR